MINESSVSARMVELRRAFAESQSKIVEARQAMSAVSVRVESPDGAISLTLDSMGQVQELDFRDDSFQELEPEELAKKLVALFHEAQGDVRRAVMELAPAPPWVGTSLESALDPAADISELSSDLFGSMFGAIGKGGGAGRE